MLSRCVNGYTNGTTSQPNVLFTDSADPVSMTALPGFVFTVTTLRVTAAWADNVTANQAGPAVANLTSLGHISTLEMVSTSCGVNATGSYYSADDACVPVPLTILVLDDIVVTGDCCDVRRRGQQKEHCWSAAQHKQTACSAPAQLSVPWCPASSKHAAEWVLPDDTLMLLGIC